MSLRVVIPAAVAAAILAACSKESTAPNTGGGTPPSHVYVADLANRVLVFAAPLADTSHPIDTIALGNSAIGVAVDDSGNIAVVGASKYLYRFDQPLSSASVPADSAAILPYYGFAAWGPDKKWYVAPQGPHVLVFTPPVTSASVADTIKDSLHDANGVAFDGTHRLYVADPAYARVEVYASPYTAAPAFAVSSLGSCEDVAVDASGRLYVSDHNKAVIRIFATPLSGSSAPVDSISTGLNDPHGIAIGGDGKLYVANLGDTSVVVYNPPFSHASAPAVRVIAGGGLAPWGIAVGK